MKLGHLWVKSLLQIRPAASTVLRTHLIKTSMLKRMIQPWTHKYFWVLTKYLKSLFKYLSQNSLSCMTKLALQQIYNIDKQQEMKGEKREQNYRLKSKARLIMMVLRHDYLKPSLSKDHLAEQYLIFRPLLNINFQYSKPATQTHSFKDCR